MTKRIDGEGHDVFISYKRRTAAAQARLIRSDLTQRGISVFMDVTDLRSGFFDESLLGRIASTRNFVLILAPHALDKVQEAGDWLRREIGRAIESGRNVVPITLPGFRFPKTLPDDIAALPRYQCVEYSHLFFDAMMERLVGMLDLPAATKRLSASADKSGGLRRWMGLAVAVLITTAATPFTAHYAKAYFANARVRRAVNALRQDFRQAVNAAPGARSQSIAAAQQDADAVFRLDANNGSGFYYSGEIKRLNHPALFTEKSCPIAGAVKTLKAANESLDAYETDFYHYLDAEAALPESAKGGGTSGELCYTRASGYCPQRTAWIDHLLANDLYQEALDEGDAAAQSSELGRALKLEQNAAGLYQDQNHNPGFTQCESTETLMRKIQGRLAGK
jgi:hypothetical protein